MIKRETYKEKVLEMYNTVPCTRKEVVARLNDPIHLNGGAVSSYTSSLFREGKIIEYEKHKYISKMLLISEAYKMTFDLLLKLTQNNDIEERINLAEVIHQGITYIIEKSLREDEIDIIKGIKGKNFHEYLEKHLEKDGKFEFCNMFV